ncbi:uncharacterized protein LOC117338040 [Pecten maximus]|uniref:uncharacterized protein LOC117338040 n=1 Tax=Pecten maximus TaxID=6579 RepID=UPI0014591479|nr:uncharacterized protein LOC117338040 [Pecten maximus]
MAALVSSLPKLMGKFKGQVPCLLRKPITKCRCHLLQLHVLSTRCTVQNMVPSSHARCASVIQSKQIHTTKNSLLPERRPEYLKHHVNHFPVIVGVASKHPKKGHLVLVDSDLIKRVGLLEFVSITATFFGSLGLCFVLLNKTLPDVVKFPLLVTYIFALLALPSVKNMEYKHRVTYMYHNAETDVFTVTTKPLFRKSTETSFTAEEVTVGDPNIKNGLYVICVGKRKFYFSPSPEVFRDQNAFTILTGET